MPTPQAVLDVLAQLEPILTRICNERGIGEVAVTYGGHQFQVEERPVTKHPGVPFQRDWGRVKVLKAAR